MSTILDPRPAAQSPPLVPGALPLLGHGVSLVRRRLEFLRQARAYGPIVELRIGPTAAYLVNEHTLLRQMLVQDAARFPRGIHFQKARAVAGNGIITASGPEHRRQRRLVLPAFNRKRVEVYAQVMREIAVQRIEGWPQDRPMELKPEFVGLATRVGTKALFSAELATPAVATVERALPVLTRRVSLRAMDPTGLLERLPTPGNRRFATMMDELHGMIDGIIGTYRATERDRDDLLSMLMAARDDETGRAMTDRQLRDEIISILLSSAETTALTLSWACHELGRHPSVQRRLQDEVDAVLGGRAPEHHELGALDLTRRIIKETLRLYPPTYFLSRTAVEEAELGGYRIPKGTTMLYSFFSQHRDPRLFPRPDHFDPDRWLPNRSADVTPDAYLPFGEGAHRCVGEGFAYAEAMTVLALIAGRWQLRPVPGERVRPVGTVTLVPADLRMTVRRRTR
ncbi:cytochrome P450 [Actinomadura roseirufa]|uniref:cytochrome P450 n=1 Tax=Actinomadura roseirufa TaxID=2094049 RepID=UPI001040EBB6|nr:cytochrome P450 [Actinomadura roseirufa]